MKWYNKKVKKEKMLQFQELVKQYDGRFITNPYQIYDHYTVSIDFDHVPMEKVNEFMKKWNLLNMTITEKNTKQTWFSKVYNRIKSFLKGLR